MKPIRIFKFQVSLQVNHNMIGKNEKKQAVHLKTYMAQDEKNKTLPEYFDYLTVILAKIYTFP